MLHFAFSGKSLPLFPGLLHTSVNPNMSIFRRRGNGAITSIDGLSEAQPAKWWSDFSPSLFLLMFVRVCFFS